MNAFDRKLILSRSHRNYGCRTIEKYRRGRFQGEIQCRDCEQAIRRVEMLFKIDGRQGPLRVSDILEAF